MIDAMNPLVKAPYTDMNRIFSLRTIGTWMALLFFLCPTIPAIEVGWHPEMTIFLGDGVKISHQKTPAFVGLVEMNSTPTTINNGWQNEIVSFAQNTFDMIKTLNANASVSLHSLNASGDMNVSFFSRQRFDANELKFVFTKTRNFGTTLFTPKGFTPLFTNQLPIFQRTLAGEALHSKITSTFGSHYVRGYQSAAFVSVVYTFRYSSASLRQSLDASAGGRIGGASFSGFVSSFFGRTNNAVSMSYQFYSSDPNKPAPFPNSGFIQTYQQFSDFVTQLESYGNSMTSANAKITGYVLDPIQSIPGYLSLLGDYVPSAADTDNSSDFLRAYSALQVWNARLSSQIGTMNWLNATGQQLLSQKARDVANYLSAMDATMEDHYTAGKPLSVPNDVVSYLGNLSDFKLPEIFVMDTFNDTDSSAIAWRYIFGRVDCGDRDLLKDIPFNSITQLFDSTNRGALAQLYFDADTFLRVATNTISSSTRYKDSTGTYDASAINRFTNTFTSAMWACLTNPATNPNLNGFFLARQRVTGTSPAARWLLAISDSRGTNVSVIPFYETLSGGCGCPDLYSGNVTVSAATSPSAPGVVGLAQPVTIQVTNQSSVASHNTTITFVLSDSFDFAGANGSQGHATFNSSNRVVTCNFGPLFPGANASLNLMLVPLRTNALPAGPATLTLGDGLTNLSPQINPTFFQIAAELPAINLERGPANLIIDWFSDSDNITVQVGSSLNAGAPWSPLTNGIVINGNHRLLPIELSGQQGFFRIRAE
jgi:hypothetical protein